MSSLPAEWSETVEPNAEDSEAETELLEQYRSLCATAVASLAVGLLSVVAIFEWALLLVPLVGIALGIHAVRKIRRYPNEYTGAPLAWAGLALSVVFLAGGATWLQYEYATELPPGFVRISYEDLQPPEGSREVIPKSAIALDGKQVLIKGYVYPGDRNSGIKEFLLVRDKGDCCFGGNPKMTERIQVQLTDTDGMDFAPWQHKVAGVFRIRIPKQTGAGLGGAFYYLDEAQLR